MEKNETLIELNIRESLVKSQRLSGASIGISFLAMGLIPVISEGLPIRKGFILIGILWLIYSLIGREIFRQKFKVSIDSGILKIKVSIRKTKKINLSLVTYLKMIPDELEICFHDYLKTYDISWLTPDEFEILKAKIYGFCKKNNIEVK
jgi:hypothetical protein